MNQQQKHVKWEQKEMPDTALQRAFERALQARERNRTVRSNMSLHDALVRNRIKGCTNHTINNYAECVYTGSSENY